MVRFPTVSWYFELGFWVRFQMNIQRGHFLKMNYRIKKYDTKMPNWAEISSPKPNVGRNRRNLEAVANKI